MKETYFPSNSTLEETVLIALKNLGGTADVPAINQEVDVYKRQVLIRTSIT